MKRNPTWKSLDFQNCLDFYNFVKIFSEKPGTATRSVLQRKNILKNVAKFTGKHLWQRVFFNNTAGLRPATLL